MNLFVTGTDTGVGKTYVTCLLVRALRSAGFDTVAMKPFCCGDRSDAELLRRAAGSQLTIDEVNPTWLHMPIAPYAVALREKRTIDLEAIRTTFKRLRDGHRSLLVEGAGGWLVPIRDDFFMSDLAAEMDLPVLVVVGNRLGALNHLLLTLQAIKTRGLKCAGIVLNHPNENRDEATATNRAVIENLTEVPILFEVTFGQRQIELAVA